MDCVSAASYVSFPILIPFNGGMRNEILAGAAAMPRPPQVEDTAPPPSRYSGRPMESWAHALPAPQTDLSQTTPRRSGPPPWWGRPSFPAPGSSARRGSGSCRLHTWKSFKEKVPYPANNHYLKSNGCRGQGVTVDPQKGEGEKERVSSVFIYASTHPLWRRSFIYDIRNWVVPPTR